MPARRQEKLAGGAGRDPLEAHELWHVRDLVGLIGDAPGERGNRAGR
jgi:hypothetical protein